MNTPQKKYYDQLIREYFQKLEYPQISEISLVLERPAGQVYLVSFGGKCDNAYACVDDQIVAGFEQKFFDRMDAYRLVLAQWLGERYMNGELKASAEEIKARFEAIIASDPTIIAMLDDPAIISAMTRIGKALRDSAGESKERPMRFSPYGPAIPQWTPPLGQTPGGDSIQAVKQETIDAIVMRYETQLGQMEQALCASHANAQNLANEAAIYKAKLEGIRAVASGENYTVVKIKEETAEEIVMEQDGIGHDGYALSDETDSDISLIQHADIYGAESIAQVMPFDLPRHIAPRWSGNGSVQSIQEHVGV